MDGRKSKLKTASQAEILRSHQRDNDFVNQINEEFSDILHKYSLFKTVTKFVKSEVPAKLLYFMVTSGIGNQTLGEEYTGIVQANLRKQKVPSFILRFLAAVLECFGEKVLVALLQKLQKTINKPNSSLKPQAVKLLNLLINRLKTAIPIIILAHRGLFYIYGKYYSIGKRLASIDYVKVYGPRPQDSISWGLRILGFATLVQCVFRLWQAKNIQIENYEDDKDFECLSSTKCQLCLEKIPNTATPCGHLFCWNCIAEWLRAKNRCPMCREVVQPSRIVPLMNL